MAKAQSRCCIGLCQHPSNAHAHKKLLVQVEMVLMSKSIDTCKCVCFTNKLGTPTGLMSSIIGDA